MLRLVEGATAAGIARRTSTTDCRNCLPENSCPRTVARTTCSHWIGRTTATGPRPEQSQSRAPSVCGATSPRKTRPLASRTLTAGSGAPGPSAANGAGGTSPRACAQASLAWKPPTTTAISRSTACGPVAGTRALVGSRSGGLGVRGRDVRECMLVCQRQSLCLGTPPSRDHRYKLFAGNELRLRCSANAIRVSVPGRLTSGNMRPKCHVSQTRRRPASPLTGCRTWIRMARWEFFSPVYGMRL
jgi:hypothetical protein